MQGCVMAGIMDVYAAIEYFGGIFTTQDVIRYTGDSNNASKYLCMLRKRGEIDSIDSVLKDVGHRKIWIKY